MAQLALDALALLRLIPEEEHALGQFLAGRLRTENGLHGVGVVACIPHLGADGHRGGGEVLYLFQLEIKSLGGDGQVHHVLFPASWVAADEIGDNLLAETFLAVDVVEKALELLELLERGLPHEVEHLVAGVFGGYLQSAAHMAANEFAGVFAHGGIGVFIAAFVQQQVLTHATANEAFLHAGQLVYGMIDVEPCMPYMLADGPPRSLRYPLKSGNCLTWRTSFRMLALLLLAMNLP